MRCAKKESTTCLEDNAVDKDDDVDEMDAI